MTMHAAKPDSDAVSALRRVQVPHDTLRAVVGEIERFASMSPLPRHERLAGIHNPWSNTSPLVHAWTFLDLCESAALVAGVQERVGPNVVLWDSQLYLRAADYLVYVDKGREGRYWPVLPLGGAVVVASFVGPPRLYAARLADLSPGSLSCLDAGAPAYVIRYFPAECAFVRDPRFPANWIAMEEQPLINYATRPLWLVGGEDKAGNDFVTGFSQAVPNWATH